MSLTRRRLLARALAGGAGAARARGVFDDGSDAIPPAVAGPVERVVVVVEARERLGGRTWTADLARRRLTSG